MLPHMIYNPRLPWRLESLIWGTGPNASAAGAPTSGLTQPPMLAIAAERVYHALPAAERPAFLAALLPGLLKFHHWIYRARDPHHTGLAACLHSWESGLDDTPYWTQAMNIMPPLPLWWRWLREYRPVNPAERTRPQDMQHMLSLAYLMRRHRYDSASLIAHSPVVIADLVFNAILAAANESLERLAEAARQPLSADLRAHFAPTRRALEQLWDPETAQYYSRDYRTGQLLTTPTAVTFMPLFAGTASLARARQLVELLTSHDYRVDHPLPTVPLTSPEFEAQRYWRGPVWINLNWFVIRGLERYGFTAPAAALRRRTLALVDRAGFREYYNPLTGDGLGAHQFSWSAALALDLLNAP